MKENKFLNYLILINVFLFSMAFFHGQEFLSSFELFRGDMGDSALIAIYREHAYRVALNFFGVVDYYSDSFLNTPWSFFPHAKVFFYADTILADLPVYAIFRVFGMNAMASQSAVMVFSTVVLYFLSFYILHKELHLDFIPSVVAGFLIAFNMPRAIMLMHSQMISGYWTLFSIFFLIRYLKKIFLNSSFEGIRWSLFFSVFCFCAQLWVSFYLGFFWALGLLALGIIYLLRFPLLDLKRRILFLSRNFILRPELVITILFTLLPLAYFHLQALKEVGGRSVSEISSGLPQITSYFAVSPASWYFHYLHWVWHYVPAGRAPEWHMFAGFIPMIFVALGFYGLRVFSRFQENSPEYQFTFYVFKYSLWIFCLIFFATFASRTGYSFWNLLGPLIPGSSAIRAMCRIALFLIIPASFLGAFVLSYMFRSRPMLQYVISILALLGVIRENFMLQDYLNSSSCMEKRLTVLENEFNKQCSLGTTKSFLLRWKKSPSWVEQESLAQWLSIKIQVPSMNGYSGNIPPRYPLQQGDYVNLENRTECEACSKWLDEFGLKQETNTNCLVVVEDAIECERIYIPKKWFP